MHTLLSVPNGHARFARYLQDMHEGKVETEAFAAHFGDFQIEQLDEAMRALAMSHHTDVIRHAARVPVPPPAKLTRLSAARTRVVIARARPR